MRLQKATVANDFAAPRSSEISRKRTKYRKVYWSFHKICKNSYESAGEMSLLWKFVSQLQNCGRLFVIDINCIAKYFYASQSIIYFAKRREFLYTVRKIWHNFVSETAKLCLLHEGIKDICEDFLFSWKPKGCLQKIFVLRVIINTFHKICKNFVCSIGKKNFFHEII